MFSCEVFRLLLDEGKITEEIVRKIRGFRHSGFSIHQEVRIDVQDRDGLEGLVQYIGRAPLSEKKMMVSEDGKSIIYHSKIIAFIKAKGSDAIHTQELIMKGFHYERLKPKIRNIACFSFRVPHCSKMNPGRKRNFKVFDPLEWLAAITVHVPEKGEHLIRYYGYFPNSSLSLNFSLDSPISIYYNSRSGGLKALKNIWGYSCDTSSKLP
ncbi:transposase [bacterium]|nr:transposase [bacterium]